MIKNAIQWLLWPVLQLVIGLIYLYRYTLGLVIGPRCRFIPSCSEYALESYQKWGLFKGTYLTFKRLLKCHPKGGSGYDPVP